MRREMVFTLVLLVLIILSACGGGDPNCTWDHLKTHPFSDCSAYEKKFHVELDQSPNIRLHENILSVSTTLNGRCVDNDRTDDVCSWETQKDANGKSVKRCVCVNTCQQTYIDSTGDKCKSDRSTGGNDDSGSTGGGNKGKKTPSSPDCSLEKGCSKVSCSRTCSDGKTHYGSAIICTPACSSHETACDACDSVTLTPP